MPYGYIDPVERVHKQHALRNLAQPPLYAQPVVYPQPIQSPLAGLPQAQAEIIAASGLGQPRRRNPEAAIAYAALGALVGYLIHANWHRAWVRGVVAWIGTFIGTWIVLTIAAGIASAFIEPGDQSDLGPILAWTALASLVIAVLASHAAVRHRPRTQPRPVAQRLADDVSGSRTPDAASSAHVTRTHGPLAGPRD